MRFHIIGLPHTIASPEFMACKTTQKVVNFAKMMTERGHTVIHYGHEEANLPCNEHVNVVSTSLWKEVYGDFDWRTQCFKQSCHEKISSKFTENAINEINKRKRPLDFLLPFGGPFNRAVCDSHQDMIVAEPSIHYAHGHFAPYKIFDSYALYHAYGSMESVAMCRQQNYEVVIPPFFDPDDYVFSKKKSDYFLVVADRFLENGVHTATQVMERAGGRLCMIGHNSTENFKHYIAGETPDYVDLQGFVDKATRNRLLSEAKGTFILSQYMSPFSTLLMESMFSGTPVITSDWGGLAEHNLNGITGFRGRTIEQMIWAVHNIEQIEPEHCRYWAMRNFSLHRIGQRYEDFFQSLLDIKESNGWYRRRDERKEFSNQELLMPQQTPIIDFTLEHQIEKTFAEQLAAWLHTHLRPMGVIDYGCGLGSFAAAFDSLSVPCVATDQPERYHVQQQVLHDNKPHPPSLRRPKIPAQAVALVRRFIPLHLLHKHELSADLMLCLDVGAHTETYEEDGLIRQVSQLLTKNGYLIWASAPPGVNHRLPGVNHTQYFNWRSKNYWLAKLEAAGLHHDPTLERKMLASFAETAPAWFSQGLLVLRRPDFAIDI